mmetsp:Transcript_15955/g.34731  ORF Transcript_15955/g.34731 Transcript_15955/m.34731 type:complete len:426 (+) Transcript_15955:685-1962(+)
MHGELQHSPRQAVGLAARVQPGAVGVTPGSRDPGGSAVERDADGEGSVVDTEPQHAELVGRPLVGHHAPAGVLGADEAFVDVFLSLGLVGQGHSEAFGALPRAGADVLRRVEPHTLEVVAHVPHGLVDANWVTCFDVQRHAVGEVVSLDVVQVVSDSLLVGSDLGEERIHSRFAKPGSLEGQRVVDVREGEIGVFPVVQLELLGKCDDVRGMLENVRLIGDELGGSGLIGVGADAAIWDLRGDPHGPLGDISLADHLHQPHLFGIRNGERLTGGGIPVGLHQVVHGGNSLPGGLGPAQCDPDELPIVNAPVVRIADCLISTSIQHLKAAKSGLPDSQLVLVGVTHYVVGLWNLRDGPEALAVIPTVDLPLLAGLVLSSRPVGQGPHEPRGIRVVGNNSRPINRRPRRDQDIGASACCCYACRGCA